MNNVKPLRVDYDNDDGDDHLNAYSRGILSRGTILDGLQLVLVIKWYWYSSLWKAHPRAT